jgi:NADH-quinone oxidoreductase subunit N
VFRGDKATNAVSGLAAAIVAGGCYFVFTAAPSSGIDNMIVSDAFSTLMKGLILIGLFFSIILSIRKAGAQAGFEGAVSRFEHPILMLFAGLGMMIMVSANDLLMLYMGLELQSLALYVLASIRRDDAKSSEAGLKYFILGAISSGMLLFGASLVYGYTGSTNFTIIGESLSAQLSIGALIGMVFIIAGIAFKISAAPFHMWTPDVYEGAPMPVTAFFAMVPKVAAIALLIRLLFEAFPAATDQWQQIIWALAALSMIVGSFAALMQDNLKRLLAYSSIGNMGFALVGLIAANPEGGAAVMVYMMLYMVMTAGTFGIILSMRRNGKPLERVSDLSGLSRNHPVIAYAMAALMFSMSGIPPLAGFFGKFLVFKAAVGAGFYGLAILGVVLSVVSAYYYLRIIKVMFFDEPAERYDGDMPFAHRAIVGFSVASMVAFIFAPSVFMSAGIAAMNIFFHTAIHASG